MALLPRWIWTYLKRQTRASDDDTATTVAGTDVTIPVLENDSDPEGGALTVESVTQPDFGTAGMLPGGTVVYKPDPDFVMGEDTVS